MICGRKKYNNRRIALFPSINRIIESRNIIVARRENQREENRREANPN